MTNKKTLFIWLVLLFILGAVAVVLKVSGEKSPRVVINGQTILVEVADSPEKRTKGLSGRDALAANRGMLFVFSEPGNHSFWMKEMKLNLDFIFVNGKEVVKVEENVPFPQDNEDPVVISPTEKYDKVLEVNQGVVNKLNIKKGDEMEFFSVSSAP